MRRSFAVRGRDRVPGAVEVAAVAIDVARVERNSSACNIGIGTGGRRRVVGAVAHAVLKGRGVGGLNILVVERDATVDRVR